MVIFLSNLVIIILLILFFSIYYLLLELKKSLEQNQTQLKELLRKKKKLPEEVTIESDIKTIEATIELINTDLVFILLIQIIINLIFNL